MTATSMLRAIATGLFTALLIATNLAVADDRVGTITAMPQNSETIEIDNRKYRISSNALVGKAPDNISGLKLKHLATGQTVHIITSGDRVTTLRVLHQPDELPD